MTTKTKKLKEGAFSPKQEKVLALLVAGSSQVEAARLSGTEPATVSRWMRNLAFKGELQRRRAEVVELIRSDVAQAILCALEAVRSGLGDEEISGAVRLQTACSFLGRMLPGLLPKEEDFEDILKREIREREMRSAFQLTTAEGIMSEAEQELKENAE
ncbi:MAG: hypothetical protein ACOYJV_00160 [Aminivibrio sp.]|jgi:DNA-binding CsgD family transcriptional regulator